MIDSFETKSTLQVGDASVTFYSLKKLEEKLPEVGRLPYSLKILLENLLRTEDGKTVTADDIEAVAKWDSQAEPSHEIAFSPSRVLLQDFTGVPAIVDLAAMRDAMKNLGGDPTRINPLQPAELVIDHSVQVDEYGTEAAFRINAEKEFSRNKERYVFLKWGQNSFENFKVVPPDTGIVHQVNLEHLARVIFNSEGVAYPDSLVGTDSHTTMINGLGVLGWGVGGIEAEAAMLGQPISMLIPQVVGFRLYGELKEGATATDLVLTVTQMLREKGVVEKFVEFYGADLVSLPLADRATLGNMSPEYGATCGIFPVDAETIKYLRLTNRLEQVELAETYCRAQGIFHTAETPVAEYSDTLELDLGTVETSLAGPKRPQDRVTLKELAPSFRKELSQLVAAEVTRVLPVKQAGAAADMDADSSTATAVAEEPESLESLDHGSVVIAAITSCTNTSNPSVMMAAGLLAKKACELGLKTKPWVKTSLAPGSKVVTDYLVDAGLMPYLEKLRFHLAGYGCTTCIGNSGPLPEAVSQVIKEKGLVATSVLSGNRNFEGRIHSEVRANYLASPPLVVAYALAGRIDIDLYDEPLGTDPEGNAVFLRDLWPSRQEVEETIQRSVRSEMFEKEYSDVFKGDDQWNSLDVPEGALYAWDENSTYVKNPPYFDGMTDSPSEVTDIQGARVLALLGDSITTDHISPAGSIAKGSPAGNYLVVHGVAPVDFNSYGSRRGNHEVMMRGTFANVRLRNQLAPGTEGGFTRHFPEGEQTTIFEASEKYRSEGVPLIILAGKEYGSGSSRDWAAKGPRLLGVSAVIAESYERIHRSNLIGMGVLPCEFIGGQNAGSLGLTGEEVYEIAGLVQGIESGFASGREVAVTATSGDSEAKTFKALVRLDTPQEVNYYCHGGILHYVIRQLLAE